MESLTGIIFAFKTQLIAILVVIFGGLAHATEQVRKYGWKGTAVFLSDAFVAMFVGLVFYQMAVTFKPEWALLAAMFGTFSGTHGFNAIKDILLGALKNIVK